MSAVVAAVGPSTREVDVAWARAALAASLPAPAERAPLHVGEGIVLGQALLRTAPREAAGVVTIDGTAHVAADVRLDDRARLLRDLAAAGRPTSGEASDAEVLLQAHAAWGAALTGKIIGDFAFVLWDGRRRELLAVRDHLGVAPLHVATAGPTLLIASAADVLLLHPEVGDELDDDVVATFLVHEYPPDHERTTFRRVRRVAPATVLTWRDGIRRETRHWEYRRYGRPLRRPSPFEAQQTVLEAIDAAVADRLPSGRVAAHLSGGLDSGSVVAAVERALTRARGDATDLRAFSVTLGAGSGDPEGDLAAVVRRTLEIDGDVIDGTDAVAVDPLAPPHPPTPEPVPYRWSDLSVRMTQTASAWSPVLLSGLGGDVLFGYSPWWWTDALRQGHPAWAVRGLLERPRVGRGRPRPHVRAVAGRLRHGPVVAGAPTWLSHDVAGLPGTGSGLWPDRFAGYDAVDLVRNPMWATIARWGHPTFSRLPVHHRHPLFDVRLLDLVAGLSPEPWLHGRSVVRDALARRLPVDVVRRPKTPLVRTRMPGDTPAGVARLETLVRDAGGLDRYVDRRGVVAELRSDAEPSRSQALARVLGLAHWLAHR